MDILILGASPELCRFLPENSEFYPRKERYPLIFALPEAKRPWGKLACDTLAVWNDIASEITEGVRAENLVTCGFAPFCTLTLSSMGNGRSVLTVQREFARADGAAVPPQDVPLPEVWSELAAEEQIMLAGLWLMTGRL